MTGKDTLADWKKNGATDATGAPADPKLAGREMKEERHPQFSVRLEWAVGDEQFPEGSGALYGLLLGCPILKLDKGIQFVFEGAYAEDFDGWVWGDWKVTLHAGKDAKPEKLFALWSGLCHSKEEFVRADETIGRIEVEPVKIPGRERE